MAVKSLRKIHIKLQFVYRRNEFLNPKLRRLLCSSLFKPHFDYAHISWYPYNKCIRFCLKLNSRQHMKV